jgi:hypothetical protein
MDATGYEHNIAHSNINDAIEAIETELGTDPAGGLATVKERIPIANSAVRPLVWPRTGTYYSTLQYGSTNSQTQTIGRVSFVPFIPPSTISISALVVNVVNPNAGTGSARLGIYSNTYTASGHRPHTLIVDAGEISAASAGFKEAAVSQQLDANVVYWISAAFSSTNPTYSTYNSTGNGAGLTRTTTISPIIGYYMSSTYGPLPSSASGLSDALMGSAGVVWVKL